MHGTTFRALAPLAIAGSILLANNLAVAAPPDPSPPPPAAYSLAVPPPADAGGKVPAGTAEKPSLLKELPIAAYVTTSVSAIVGAILNVFGGNAAKDLQDPAKHTTPDQTHSLVVRARVGQVVSGVMFGVTGASTVWGTISTVRAVMKIKAMVKVPPVGVTAAPLPGGFVAGVGGRF